MIKGFKKFCVFLLCLLRAIKVQSKSNSSWAIVVASRWIRRKKLQRVCVGQLKSNGSWAILLKTLTYVLVWAPKNLVGIVVSFAFYLLSLIIISFILFVVILVSIFFFAKRVMFGPSIRFLNNPYVFCYVA